MNWAINWISNSYKASCSAYTCIKGSTINHLGGMVQNGKKNCSDTPQKNLWRVAEKKIVHRNPHPSIRIIFFSRAGAVWNFFFLESGLQNFFFLGEWPSKFFFLEKGLRIFFSRFPPPPQIINGRPLISCKPPDAFSMKAIQIRNCECILQSMPCTGEITDLDNSTE